MLSHEERLARLQKTRRTIRLQEILVERRPLFFVLLYYCLWFFIFDVSRCISEVVFTFSRKRTWTDEYSLPLLLSLITFVPSHRIPNSWLRKWVGRKQEKPQGKETEVL